MAGSLSRPVSHADSCLIPKKTTAPASRHAWRHVPRIATPKRRMPLGRVPTKMDELAVRLACAWNSKIAKCRRPPELLIRHEQVRIGSCGNEWHDMRCHRSTMVLRGRGSAPAAASSGSLFLKPPALPEDTYSGIASERGRQAMEGCSSQDNPVVSERNPLLAADPTAPARTESKQLATTP